MAQDPNIRTTATGKLVTKVRVGTTPRYRDSATGQWRDAETSDVRAEQPPADAGVALGITDP